MYLGFLQWKQAPVALQLLLLSALYTPSSALWPFPKKRFRGNSLIDTGTIGLSGDGRAVAYGDFNGDQSLDILVLESDQQTLTVYDWNHAKFTFEASVSIKHARNVLNVVPGDFTHTGKLDLLVMSQSQVNGNVDLTLYPALQSQGFDVTHPLNLPTSTTVQPIPIDVDGDLKIDLLGVTPSSKDDPENKFQIWHNIWDSTADSPTLFKITDADFNGRQCSISNPHSNAVIDLDGDCLADIFVVCDDGKGGKTYQIWINKKADGFVLSQEGSLPSGMQSMSFMDIDRDGTIDMVFPTCSSVSQSTGVGSDCYINIAYNQQLPLCSSSTDSGVRKGVRTCRPPGDLCTADPNFKYNLSDSPDNNAFARFPISSLFPSSSLLVLDTTFNPPLPIPLKFGDINLDGFPDMLAITVSGSDRLPLLVYSVPCGSGVAGCQANGSGKRGWKIATDGVDALKGIKDARACSFLDIDEDGTLDIFVQRSGSDGKGHYLFVHNNFYYDAFFLKAIVLNGACDNGWCTSPNGSDYNPFGVSYSGATYKYTVLDTAGHRSAAQVGQLPQTAYQSLGTPYSFFGLGRTNNYIENLFIGTTIHVPEHYINLEGVIPNSKVVIFPSAEEGESWKRELFLRPGEWIPWVTVTAVAGTLVLAIIVFVLHLNEKREDELERRRISHHINFDAL